MSKQTNQGVYGSQAWLDLEQHQQAMSASRLNDLFNNDPLRAQKYSISFDEVVIDFSKNLIDDETLKLLFKLAGTAGLKDKISGLLNGEKINKTENRPALHTACRLPPGTSLTVDGEDVIPGLQQELIHAEEFVNKLHDNEIKGSTGKPITTIINIGIGGSDLGPRLTVESLREYNITSRQIKFVSNLDATDLDCALEGSDPETTLFIVASKSFSTLETLANANSARAWLAANQCTDVSNHFVAVTSNRQGAIEYGVKEEKIFHFPEWVGGRYSVWSVVGLPLVISIGMDRFREFLAGAHAMDRHFAEAEFNSNIPVMLGLLSAWYNNFFKFNTTAIIPYDQRLKLLPEYLGQLVMESNGKSVDRHGNSIDYPSAAILWGGVGTNSQHAFFQLLHQGKHTVPVDFLISLTGNNKEHHEKLFANCVAQSKALMLGENNEEFTYKNYPGNKPSNTILFEQLTPRVLGMLLALYEHKTFVEAVIWDINPFDQWGVELGKTMANNLAQLLSTNQGIAADEDTSTKFLLEQYRKYNS